MADLELRFGDDAPDVAALHPASRFGGDYNAARARVIGDSGIVCSTHDTARLAADAGRKVFMYDFNVEWSIGAALLHAGHAGEISHVFGMPWLPAPDPDSEAVGAAMNAYWARFAATFDPNGEGAPATWPEFTTAADRRLQLDPGWEVLTDFRTEECALWRKRGTRVAPRVRCTLRRMTTADKLHYVRIPNALGGRAEMVRMCYALAERPYVDVLHAMADVQSVVTGKNPFKQFPFVETAAGEIIYQSLAIMHHAAHGTSAWPSEPSLLTRALAVGMGGYDLFQWFGGFPADDLAGKKRFEERRAPQFFAALDECYRGGAFAIGATPTFADCIVYEAVAWCTRRNERCRELLGASPALAAFQARFAAVPAIAAFMARQAAARAVDDSV